MRLGAVGRITGFPASHRGQEVVPGYVLGERIGKGRTGEVWSAEGPGGFDAALRFIPLPAGLGEAESRALEILRGVRHPNVVSTFGSFLLGDWLILAMERADGTLPDRIGGDDAASPRVERAQLIDWLADAAQGIDHLNLGPHAGGRRGAGILHGGIRPGNLHFVGGGVKVAGPWAPQWLEEPVCRYLGRLLDPEHAAPELFLGFASRRSDQYSLAVTYCELRGGRLPFSGAADDLATEHLTRAPDLTMIAEDERPAVERALAKAPEQRWESCGAFLDALRSAVKAPSARPLAPGLAPRETPGGAVVPVEAQESASFPPTPPEGPSFQGTGDRPSNPRQSHLDHHRARTGRPMIVALVSAALVGSGALVAWREGRLPAAEGGDVARGRPTAGAISADGSGAVRRSMFEPETERIPPAPRLGRWAETPRAIQARHRPAEENGEASWKSPVSRARDLVARASRSVRGKVSTVASSWPSTPWPKTEVDVRAVPAPASLSLETPESLDVPAGRGAKLPIRVTRRGNSEPVEIRFEGVPRGVSVSDTVLAGDRSEAECEVRIDRGASIDPVPIQVVASAGSLRADSSVRLVPRPTPALEPRSRGEGLLAQGKLDLALAAYREAVRLDPSDAASSLGLARALIASGSPDAATDALDEAIRLDPACVQAYRLRGDARQASGDRAGALSDYDAALRLRPDDAALLNKRGLVLARQGELHRAIADFDRAIGLDPEDAAPHYNRGRVYDRLGDAVEAIAGYDRAIRLDPNLSPAFRARAAAHSRRGDEARARADREAAARLEEASGHERAATRPAPPARQSPKERGARDEG